MKNNYVIGIQCFNKLDTLEIVLNHLENCYGVDKYTLILFVDTSHNMPYTTRLYWHELNQKVKSYVRSYSSNRFKSIIKIESENNLGPYIGCKKTVDICLEHSDFIVFMEDDSVVSKDYLYFYEKLFELMTNDDVFAGSACSVSRFFKESEKYNVQKVGWINPTEFAITKHQWQKFGHLRGEICGDVRFGEAVKQNDKYTLMPIIPRMCKIGKGHPDSFSVLHNAVEESKNENIIFLPSNNFDINYYMDLNII